MGRPTCRRFFCSFGPQFGNNAPTSDNRQLNRLQVFRRKCAAYGPVSRPIIVLGVLSGMLAACEETGNHVAASTAAVAPVLACGQAGFLTTTLYGAISTTLDWTATDMACEGMPRPDNEGARLRLAGLDGDRQIAFIIAIPRLERGMTGNELPSNCRDRAC